MKPMAQKKVQTKKAVQKKPMVKTQKKPMPRKR